MWCSRVLAGLSEKELETKLNSFLEKIDEEKVIDIKFDASISESEENRTELYSVLVLYKK